MKTKTPYRILVKNNSHLAKTMLMVLQWPESLKKATALKMLSAQVKPSKQPHRPSGIIKARRAAKKLRYKLRSTA